MDLKKQAIILAIIVSLVGVIQVSYNKLFNQYSSPASSAIELAKNHLDIDTVLKSVSISDKEIVNSLKQEYITLTKLPTKKISKVEVAADIVLSEKNHKVDLQTDQGLVSFNMIKEQERWVANLNLKTSYEVKQLLSSLKDAETEEDEFKMLTIYRKLNELSPSEEYQTRIEKLTKYIELKEAKAGYVKNIIVSDLSLKGRVLTGLIKNIGDKAVSTIKVSLQIVNQDGSVKEDIPVTLYEVIPGSMVFGQPINGGYQKKFGLDMLNIKQITSVKNLVITVNEVDFP